MELTEQETKTLLTALYRLGSTGRTDEEQELVERAEVELVAENIKERESVKLTVTRNKLGWHTAWIHVDGTLEAGGSFIPAHDTLFNKHKDRFSMSVWNGQRWVTSDTLGGSND